MSARARWHDAGEVKTARPETRAPDHFGFSHPFEVVRAAGIPHEDKLRLLLDWLEDEVALLVADDEGMFGGAPSRVDGVLEALWMLDPDWRVTA